MLKNEVWKIHRVFTRQFSSCSSWSGTFVPGPPAWIFDYWWQLTTMFYPSLIPWLHIQVDWNIHELTHHASTLEKIPWTSPTLACERQCWDLQGHSRLAPLLSWHIPGLPLQCSPSTFKTSWIHWTYSCTISITSYPSELGLVWL